MACPCCSKSSGYDPKILARIRGRLKDVNNIFPGTNTWILVTAEGDAVVQSDSKQSADDVLPNIAALKKSASQFAMTVSLGQQECTVIHVRGNNHIFSCFDIDGRNVLAFYTAMHGAEVATFDTSRADDEMTAILRDISSYLKEIML